MAERALVVGLGVSGAAVARALDLRGHDVVVVDDDPGPAALRRAEELSAVGVDVVLRPETATLAALVRSAGLVVPSPGVPPSHSVFGLARGAGTGVVGEIELASRWTDRALVAITGTNGKTTVTGLVTDMLVASGVAAVAAGNIGVPLVQAVAGPAEVLVVEVSSFQLELTDQFHPAVALWLNLAPDHLDWHPDMETYGMAKARIWARQGPDDTAVVNADDAGVMRWAATAPGRVETFGLTGAGFLWWNAAPARIFMGDIGSQAIGAGLAALALTTNTHLLLPIVGGVFVIVTLSVVVQVAAFRLFHRRVFRMAPIHHHFELMGWPETTVIVRFWILAGLCTALAMGAFYADFLASPVGRLLTGG